MKFLKYIATISLPLNITLLIAIVSIFAMELYLFEVPEIVPWGSEFGNVFYKLCLSIMASYVFYFIVVHIKSESDKENINAFVATKAFNVVGAYKSQIHELKKASKSTTDEEYLPKSEVDNIFKSINPKSNAPLVLGQRGNYANWIQYMAHQNTRTQNLIQKIFVKMPFLDSELVILLAEIDDCDHFGIIDAILNMQLNNTDMSAWASTFYDYSTLCKNLENYSDKKLAKYRSQP